MAVTNYYSVNGQIIGEKTTGGSRIDYLTDALGSVTATVDQSANIINTYRYKPYGGLLAKTGAGADPSFQWVGNQGYRQTGKSYADVYIRRRHYSSVLGRWTTKDPMGNINGLNRYLYVIQRPTVNIDPTGWACNLRLSVIEAGRALSRCGKAVFRIRIQLLNPGRREDGWVIQHVTSKPRSTPASKLKSLLPKGPLPPAICLHETRRSLLP